MHAVVLALLALRAGTDPTRRFAVAGAAALSLTSSPFAIRAAESFETVEDKVTGSSFRVPAAYQISSKQMSPSSPPLIIGFDPSTPSTSCFLSVQAIRPDYPTLGSFGTPEDVLANILPPPDTPGVSSKVLAVKREQKGGEVLTFDYTVASPDGDRHFQTAFALADAPTGAHYLVILSAQAEEANYASVAKDMQGIVSSLALPPRQ